MSWLSSKSKRTAEVQALLDKKQAETEPTSKPSGGKVDEKPTKKKGWREHVRNNLWTITLLIAGGLLFYLKIYSPELQLADVGDWSWSHWIVLPTLFGILYALIELNRDALKKAAGVLETILVTGAFMLYLGFPATFWVRDALMPTPICPDLTSQETRSCIVKTAWSMLVKFESPADNGKQVCFAPSNVQFERTEENGTTFWRFRVKKGQERLLLRLYPAGQKCPDVL